MALTSCIRSVRRKPSSLCSNNSKPRATSSSAWKLPHPPSKTSSSNSPEGGYAIEKLCRLDAYAYPNCFPQQDVFLFRDFYALHLLFSMAWPACQGHSGALRLLPRPRRGFQRDGQFLGTQRYIGDVSRTGNPSQVSRRPRYCQRLAGVERRRQLRAYSSHSRSGAFLCPSNLPCPQPWQPHHAFSFGFHRHHFLRLARFGRRQRNQHHARNPGAEPALVVATDFSVWRDLPTCFHAAHRAAFWPVSSRNLSCQRCAAGHPKWRDSLEPLRGNPLAGPMGLPYFFSLRATLPLGTRGQCSAARQIAGCSNHYSLSPFGRCRKHVGSCSRRSEHCSGEI